MSSTLSLTSTSGTDVMNLDARPFSYIPQAPWSCRCISKMVLSSAESLMSSEGVDPVVCLTPIASTGCCEHCWGVTFSGITGPPSACLDINKSWVLQYAGTVPRGIFARSRTTGESWPMESLQWRLVNPVHSSRRGEHRHSRQSPVNRVPRVTPGIAHRLNCSASGFIRCQPVALSPLNQNPNQSGNPLAMNFTSYLTRSVSGAPVVQFVPSGSSG